MTTPMGLTWEKRETIPAVTASALVRNDSSMSVRQIPIFRTAELIQYPLPLFERDSQGLLYLLLSLSQKLKRHQQPCMACVIKPEIDRVLIPLEAAAASPERLHAADLTRDPDFFPRG